MGREENRVGKKKGLEILKRAQAIEFKLWI
jgi:hypothetical protein